MFLWKSLHLIFVRLPTELLPSVKCPLDRHKQNLMLHAIELQYHKRRIGLVLMAAQHQQGDAMVSWTLQATNWIWNTFSSTFFYIYSSFWKQILVLCIECWMAVGTYVIVSANYYIIKEKNEYYSNNTHFSKQQKESKDI